MPIIPDSIRNQIPILNGTSGNQEADQYAKIFEASGIKPNIPFINYKDPNNGRGLTQESRNDAGAVAGGAVGSYFGPYGYYAGAAIGSLVEDLISGQAKFDFSWDEIGDLFSLQGLTGIENIDSIDGTKKEGS